MTTDTLQRFIDAAQSVGSIISPANSSLEIAEYIAARLNGPLLLPDFPDARELALSDAFRSKGCHVIETDMRSQAASADAGLTGVNFAIAETGTLVLESTREDIRLASTLPAKHFVLLNPANIVANDIDAVPLVRKLNQQHPATYLAYITGPSRTADIERVLTIGVHGPKELHILLCDTCGDDPLSM